MVHKKKFNIWIAYSDLFSNLAVFLFISAFGVLAALGSGLHPIINPYDNRGCMKEIPGDINTVIQAKGVDDGRSSMTPQSTGMVDKKNCFNRYSVNFPFYSGSPSNNFLLNQDSPKSDNDPANQDLSKHVCGQLWGAVNKNSLTDYNGHISIVVMLGTRSATTPVCKTKESQRSPRMTLVDCWVASNGDEEARKKCIFPKEFEDCGHHNSRSISSCSTFLDDLDREAVRRTSCLGPEANRRAQNIYQFCRRQILNPRFSYHLIWETGGIVPPNSHNYLKLNDLWDKRVSSRGEVDGDKPDAVFVDAEFNREPAALLKPPKSKKP